MSETKPTGGAAFPIIGAIEPARLDHDAMRNGDRPDSYDVTTIGGLSIRDYFAAKAMGAMLCADADNGRFRDTGDRTAAFAYEVADAMLRARKDGGQ